MTIDWNKVATTVHGMTDDQLLFSDLHDILRPSMKADKKDVEILEAFIRAENQSREETRQSAKD